VLSSTWHLPDLADIASGSTAERLKSARAVNQKPILQTWFYPVTFVLNADHQIQAVNQPLYPMGTRCTVRLPFDIRSSPEDSTVVAHLVRGDSLEIVASDDLHWCIIELKSGLWGWIEVFEYGRAEPNGKSWSDFLEGLNYAD
jgi:hypothetical protein